MTKLHQLTENGQAMWLDYIRHSLISEGDLARLIDDGLRGMTSNPTIFEAAISQTDEYDQQIMELAHQGVSTEDLYEHLIVRDIQAAADVFRPLYDASSGADGYVSLEANPHLAYHTDKTIAEVERLHEWVDRPNVMFKVPATPEGIIAVEHLLSEGININITLMFSMRHYERVAEAYIAGINKLALRCNNGELARLASVASFFLSRIDVKVDEWLEQAGRHDLIGKTAIANARAVYQRFRQVFNNAHWESLHDVGAGVQRILWASTSTKNPDLPDTLYIDSLIGEDTVNTVPMKTLNAFRDHGTVRAQTVEDDLEAAQAHLEALKSMDIDLIHVGEELQVEGVQKFRASYDSLIGTLGRKRQQIVKA